MARAYASLVHAYLSDASADGSHPVHVVELATADRPLAPRLLHHLGRMLQDSPSLPAFRYVVALPDDGAIERWRADEALARWIARGGVELGRLDVAEQALIVGERRIRAGGLDHLLVLADEALGTLPQAAWRVGAGAPEPLSDDAASADDDLLDDDLVLATYARRLRSAELRLPVGAFRALDALQAIAGGLALVTTDRGAEEVGDLEGASLPTGADGGAPSLDHAALRLYAALRGGSVASEGGLAAGRVSTLLAFGDRRRIGSTRAAWRRLAQDGALDPAPVTPTAPARHLAALRAHAWDPDVFHALLPALLATLPTASAAERRALARGAEAVAAQLPADDPRDVWLDLGRLLVALGFPDAATRAAQASVLRRGPSSARLALLATCASALRRPREAETYARAALDHDPREAP